jgi:hypothetical protein
MAQLITSLDREPSSTLYHLRPHIENTPTPQTNQITCTRAVDKGSGLVLRILGEITKLPIHRPSRLWNCFSTERYLL